MKRHLLFILIIINSFEMLAQKQSTFIYELTLYEPYKHRSMWTDREREIQKAHIDYLDNLEKEGRLILAGIMDQNLEQHTGFVILSTDSYRKAFEIVQNDPSIKEGMMSAKIRQVNVYFRSDN